MSGSIIGAVVGATIGFLIAGPMGALWGLGLGTMAGGLLMPMQMKSPSIGDAQKQTAQVGVVRPWIIGHPAPFAGTLVDGDRKARKFTKKTKSGKGGGSQKTDGWKLTYAIQIGEPIGGVIRAWRNGECVIDNRAVADMPGYSLGGTTLVKLVSYFNEMRVKGSKWKGTVRIYLGGEAQLPDPSLEALPHNGVGNTPYYRGSSYAVIVDDDVTAFGGVAPQWTWEVAAAVVNTNVYATPSFMGNLGAWYAFDGDVCATYPYNPTYNRWTEYFGGTAGTFSTGKKGQEVEFQGPCLTTVWAPGYIFGNAVGFACWVNLNGGLTHKEQLGFFRNDTPTYYRSGFLSLLFEATGSGSVNITLKFFDASVTPQVYVATTAYTVTGGRHYVGIDYDPLTFTAHLMVDNAIVRSVTSTAHPIDLAWFAHFDASHGDGGGPAFTANPLVHVDELAIFRHASNTGLRGGGGGFNYLHNGGQGRNYTEAMSGAPSALPLALPDADDSYYDPVTRTFVHAAGSTTTAPANTVTLEDAVNAIADRCEVPVSRRDYGALSGITIPGMLIAEQGSGFDAISPLMQAYFFDLPEVDGKSVAVLRGGAVAADITVANLVKRTKLDRFVYPQAMEVPFKVSVVAQDPAADYSAIPQTSNRFSPNVQGKSELSVQVPIPMPGTQAKQIADKLHKILFSRAEAQVELALPEEFSYLVKSDAITFDSRRWFINQTDYANGVNTIKCVYDRASNYGSTAVAVVPVPPTPPVSNLLGPTMFLAANLPSLRPQDTVAGVYLFAQGVFGGWPGADIYMSADGGASYALVLTITQPSIMGYLYANEPVGGEPLTVRLYSADDVLESVTAAQVLTGSNSATLVSAANVAEVFAFETATENVDENWELTGTTRGMLVTVDANHVAGDRFAMLDTAYFLPVDPALAGVTLIFRAVTLGTAIDANPTVSLVFEPPIYFHDGGEVVP